MEDDESLVKSDLMRHPGPLPAQGGEPASVARRDGDSCDAAPCPHHTVRNRRNQLHQLDVYRCALQLYRRIGAIVGQFPRGEADLRSQMRRAARSLPFNIGEGVGKRGKARAAAYTVALGEVKELIVSLDCVEIDELAASNEIVAAQDLADRIAAMLTRLIQSTNVAPL